jgi:hypothetical protein
MCICSYGSDEEETNDAEAYAKRCLSFRNTRVLFSGAVSAVPVPKGGDRIFTLHMSTYLRKENGKSVYSVFDIHCVFAGVTYCWWVPRVGKWTTIQGDIVGEYGRPSLCVVVQNFTPAHPQRKRLRYRLSPLVPVPSKGLPGMVIITLHI